MKKFNIIGDIGGQFDALVKLVEKMPKADKIILVGDLMDRGPKSKEVIEWAMANKETVISLYGNHEDMCVDYKEHNGKYGAGVWKSNGGYHTLLSYNGVIPQEHVDWIKSLPLEFETEDFIVTHAPIPEEGKPNFEAEEFGVFWNRLAPIPKGKLQIYGHNHNLKTHLKSDGEIYALCIDSTAQKKLTGVHLVIENKEDKEIQWFEQEW